MSLYVALLFVALTPGVLLRLPKNGKPLMVAVVHGVVFAVVFHFTHKLVWNALYKEGFQMPPPPQMGPPMMQSTSSV